MKAILHAALLLLIFASCNPTARDSHVEEKPKQTTPVLFPAYWQTGGAEITSYSLKQARYGEIREGNAVMVFVTEPFSKAKHVKLDDWQNAGSDRVDVLKLNMTKDFVTGIYPYHMMMSTFTPSGGPTLKVTTTVTEWCGQVFMQLNKAGKAGYRLQANSYFESEGDKVMDISTELLEDQLWSTIRINPMQLPVGEFDLLPGTFYLRLKHRPESPVKAVGELNQGIETGFCDRTHSTYMLTYQDRTLKIHFETDAPHGILGWEETYTDRRDGTQFTTEARRMTTIRSEYWSKNSTGDEHLRKELGL
jgi:hypothetical protein